MALTVGNTPVKSVYVGSTPVKSVYVGSDLVWSATVQIEVSTSAHDARDQFRAALADLGLDYRTITEVPFEIELVGSGSVSDMFRDCAELTTVPEMDTSQVTSMYAMFHSCYSLTHVPDMDTSRVTDTRYMFYYCGNLTDGNVRLNGRHSNVNTDNMIEGSGLTYEPFSTVQITLSTSTNVVRDRFRAVLAERGLDYQTVKELPFDIELLGSGTARDMFRDCAALTSVPPMDTSGVTNMYGMFRNCGALTSVPPMDTSNVFNMYGMFHSCYALTHVPDMNTSKVTNMSHTFYYCGSLTDGNVRLIGKHREVDTHSMIDGSGLTRLPFYDTAGNPI